MSTVPRFSSNASSNVGCVKWFNNKAGYGFITSGSDENSSDIFVHHSSIFVDKNQYKYLVQGEYVSFDLEKVDGNEKFTHQAKNVRGINSGPLMCETRNQNLQSKSSKSPAQMLNKVDLGQQWMLVQRKSQGRTNRDNNKKATA